MFGKFNKKKNEKLLNQQKNIFTHFAFEFIFIFQKIKKTGFIPILRPLS